MQNVCKSCGGQYERVGNYYVCEYCGSKWEIDASNDIHAVDRANAWSSLREGDFEKAATLFENIILSDGKNHEAYWGRALATSGILYVNDMNENKKVPTCNNITEESFIKSNDVEKAIALAPADIAESYKSQAKYIESVRREWLEKASREPAYDVFISFKDSDRENNIERTQDSIDAQDLYNALVAEGYNVFFSRISLRDKISEQYEPYIYNAINTAKVMIVFGEKAEYFSSVWIKNEWARFMSRIEKGEKHKNSLVVVYKNMNPGDLPATLKRRQCLNASDMTFLSDLTKHIKRVVEESKQAVRLEKISVQGGQVSKKAARIEQETISVREIGEGAIAETSISEKQQLSLADSYISMNQFEDAIKIIEDVLFNNPNSPEAIWKKLLIKYKCKNEGEIIFYTPGFSAEDYAIIEKTLNRETKEGATRILNLLYSADECIDEDTYCKILKTILPYQFSGRKSRIEEDFKTAIAKSRFKTFSILLGTLNSDEVDKYVKYHLDFEAQVCKNLDYKQGLELRNKCIDAVLAVDSGNVHALERRFTICHTEGGSVAERLGCFKEMLKYSKNVDERVKWALNYSIDSMSDVRDAEFANEVLRYYTKPLETLKVTLMETVSAMLHCKDCFDEAGKMLGIILTFAKDDPEVYWKICLMKTKSYSDESLVESPIFVKDIPEYTKYLAMVDEKRRLECMDLAKRQMGKKKKKKNFATIAAIIGAIAALVIAAFVYYSTLPEADYKFEFADGGVIITSIPNEAEVIIPSEILGKPVIKIEGEYFNDKNDKIESIVIPEGVTEIGEYAFSDMQSLKKLVIPDTVTVIDKDAFGTSSLVPHIEELTAPATALKSVPQTTLKKVTVTSGDEIPDYALKRATQLESIALSEGIKTIGASAFEDCGSLKAITLPASVTEIAVSAFSNSAITSIVIPDGVTKIANYTFAYCDNLTSITLPDSITEIGWNAFERCESLTGIVIPDSVTSIDNNAFENSGITSLLIPDSVEEIGENAFGYCSSLKSVIFGNGITEISRSLFNGCSALESVTIPDSVTSIGGSAFSDCTSLTSIVIPDSVTSIDSYAFNGCASLKSITLSNNLTYINSGVFSQCKALAEIVIPEGITELRFYSFDGCDSLKSITLPSTLTEIDSSAFSTNIEKLTIHAKAMEALIVNSYSNYFIEGFEEIKEIVFTGANEITRNIFANFDSLTSIVIGNDVTVIGEYAFAGLDKLTSVVIPESVEIIRGYAFRGCTSLTSIVIPDSVTEIGSNIFEGCTSLESVIIPAGVTEIGYYAFTNCNSLTSVVIPESVRFIGSYAFRYCSSLTDVYYTGSEEQWSAINVGSYNDNLTNATIHYNYVPEN